MRLQFALGNKGDGHVDFKNAVMEGAHNFLISFASTKEAVMQRIKSTKTKNEEHKVRLMLDSGAFSAHTKGEDIDLNEYMQYIKKHAALIDTYFNLDVIPGQKGVTVKTEGRKVSGEARPLKMIEEAAALSYKNLKIMKKAGLTPIPVFHQQEDFKWLHLMIKDGDPYIALSTYKELDSTDHEKWLDECFTFLTDKQGKPIRKVHGLGVASFDMLKRYPWESCDATSWALTAAYGAIYVPVYKDGKPDFSMPPVKLTVSEVEREKGMPSDHYLKYGPIMKKRVEDFLINYVGTTPTEVAVDYVQRARAIVYFYLKFQDAIGDVTFRFRTRSLLTQ